MVCRNRRTNEKNWRHRAPSRTAGHRPRTPLLSQTDQRLRNSAPAFFRRFQWNLPRMKLLIVDDELDLCCLLREHFEEHFDGAVFTATTPGEALRLLEELQPEGMLLDINLRSRLNGFDVLARAA